MKLYAKNIAFLGKFASPFFFFFHLFYQFKSYVSSTTVFFLHNCMKI